MEPSSAEALRQIVLGAGRSDDAFFVFIARYAAAEGKLDALRQAFPEKRSILDSASQADLRTASHGNPKSETFLKDFRAALWASKAGEACHS